MKADNQPKRGPGRPRNSVKQARQKKEDLLYVRLTPPVFAYLKRLNEIDGFTYSDGARLLILEAMRARGVTPAV